MSGIALTPAHIGKRLLIREISDSGYFEVKLIEISPNGTRMNLLFEADHSLWCDIDQYVVEEVLPDPVKKKRRKARKRKPKTKKRVTKKKRTPKDSGRAR